MNHYETLGIDRDYHQNAIRRAYLKLCKKWHPDKFKGEQEKQISHEKLIEINKAYNVLKDPIKREHYDRTGEDTETSIEVQVRTTLLTFFSQAVDHNNRVSNIISFVRNKIDQEIEKIEHSRIVCRQEIERIKVKKDKIKVKEGQENYFYMVIDQKIGMLEDQLVKMKEGENILNTYYDKLKDYVSEEDSSRDEMFSQVYLPKSKYERW